MNIAARVTFALALLASQPVLAQNPPQDLLLSKDSILVTVFLKHNQEMNNVQRGEVLQKAGFDKMFPPEGVEVVNHYVMMGIGQVLVLRLPPERLRILNRAIELSAWGAYQTEFYLTYDLMGARRAETQQTPPTQK